MTPTTTQVAENRHSWVGAARPHGGPRWVQDLRERGASRFAALGFPTVRDEEWRFTNVAPVASAEFQPADASALVTEKQLSALIYGDAPHRLVVGNGRNPPEVSRV